MGNPPGGSIEERVQWLVDRAMINDLLVEHARCLDQRDWATLQSLFTDDGYLQLPYDRVPAQLMARLSEEHLSGYARRDAAHERQLRDLDRRRPGERALVLPRRARQQRRSYDHGDVAGWYDSTFRRVGDGWRFVSIDETFRWKSGSGLPDETYVPKAPRD